MDAQGAVPDIRRTTHSALSHAGWVEFIDPRDRDMPLRELIEDVWWPSLEADPATSKWLGHTHPAITLRVYAHFMPEADGRGRRAVDAWFAPPAIELKTISLDPGLRFPSPETPR
ncbi:hypothetical protein [Streptomyces xanthochromogenes]|uniref:hypothetical protein n=1 Tax=Streptomyces xanthochromogenes TaxID=67384 RepID=UPI002F420E9A